MWPVTEAIASESERLYAALASRDVFGLAVDQLGAALDGKDGAGQVAW